MLIKNIFDERNKQQAIIWDQKRHLVLIEQQWRKHSQKNKIELRKKSPYLGCFDNSIKVQTLQSFKNILWMQCHEFVVMLKC